MNRWRFLTSSKLFLIYLETFLWNMPRFFFRFSALAHTFRIYEKIFAIRQKKFFFGKNDFFWGSHLPTYFDMLPLAKKILSIFAWVITKLSIIWHLDQSFSTTPSFHTECPSQIVIIWRDFFDFDLRGWFFSLKKTYLTLAKISLFGIYIRKHMTHCAWKVFFYFFISFKINCLV